MIDKFLRWVYKKDLIEPTELDDIMDIFNPIGVLNTGPEKLGDDRDRILEKVTLLMRCGYAEYANMKDVWRLSNRGMEIRRTGGLVAQKLKDFRAGLSFYLQLGILATGIISLLLIVLFEFR